MTCGFFSTTKASQVVWAHAPDNFFMHVPAKLPGGGWLGDGATCLLVVRSLHCACCPVRHCCHLGCPLVDALPVQVYCWPVPFVHTSSFPSRPHPPAWLPASSALLVLVVRSLLFSLPRFVPWQSSCAASPCISPPSRQATSTCTCLELPFVPHHMHQFHLAQALP